MPLYTFIMEYYGGTYISQIEEKDSKSACLSWAESLNVKPIFNFSFKSKEQLLKEIKDQEPTEIKDVINTWFISANIFGKNAYINIVRTEK